MNARSALLVIVSATWVIQGRVFDRCQLVRELSKEAHRIPQGYVATWVCIARHESEYNTSAVGHLNVDSGDHGIFQISDRYWCSPPGVGTTCGLGCDLLEDDDLADDVACALRIHRDHGRRDGDGFTAWAVYRPFCSGDVSEYMRGCELPPGQDFEEGGDYVLPTVKTQTVPRYPASPPLPTSRSAVLKTTPPPGDRGKYKPSKSNPTAGVLKKPYINRHGKKLSDDTATLSGVSYVSTSATPSRSSGTGLSQPPASSSGLDPRSAWHRVHYDPRFLDELP